MRQASGSQRFAPGYLLWHRNFGVPRRPNQFGPYQRTKGVGGSSVNVVLTPSPAGRGYMGQRLLRPFWTRFRIRIYGLLIRQSRAFRLLVEDRALIRTWRLRLRFTDSSAPSMECSRNVVGSHPSILTRLGVRRFEAGERPRTSVPVW